MAESKIIGFRAADTIHSALDRAARVHGTNRTELLVAWVTARLIAEGFLQEDNGNGN